MIIAIDTHYRDLAKTVAIGFQGWESEEIVEINVSYVEYLEEYVPGEFYKRELPCILDVLTQFEKSDIELIIVDGYVTLNNQGKLGLGGYLYEELNKEIPIIGVAKKNYSEASDNQIAITRGESKNPLFVTAMGIDLEESADLIKNMKGSYRIPNLLKLVDQKSKETSYI